MHGTVPVLPPFPVQQRAWERAWVLSEDHADELPAGALDVCREVVAGDAARLTWGEIGALIALYDAIVPRRV